MIGRLFDMRLQQIFQQRQNSFKQTVVIGNDFSRSGQFAGFFHRFNHPKMTLSKRSFFSKIVAFPCMEG